MATRTVDGPDKEYLDIKDVAAFTRLSEKTIRRLIRQGEFPRPADVTGQTGPAAVRMWHWRAVLYWTLRVEMRPYLRATPPKEKKKSPAQG